MTDSLKTLLIGSWSFLLSHIRPILIAAVIFGVLMFGMQKILAVQTAENMGQRFGDIEQMQDLVQRIEDGDEEAFQEMMMQMGMMGDEGEISGKAVDKATKDLMTNMLPLFGIFFLAMMVLTLVSSTFYIVLAIEGSQDFMTTLRRVSGVIVPMFGVWIWSFIRSFAWIPVIGMFIAIIIGPRLVLSSVILVKEKKGVIESVSLSYARTRGYWGKIVGNCIVAAIVVMIAMFVLSIGVSMLSVASVTAAAIVGAILQSITVAYGAIFLVRLSNTISDHPLAPTSVK